MLINLFNPGFEGYGEESVAEAMCRSGSGFGGDQAVLPRGRYRAQDEPRQQIGGTQVTSTCSVTLHANHGRVDQKLCVFANQSG